MSPQALRHPFLSQLHDPADEDVSGVPKFDFLDDSLKTTKDVKDAIYQETMEFHHRNPHTMTKEMRERLAKQQPRSLPAGDCAVRTGFEGTVNPQVCFRAHRLSLPPPSSCFSASLTAAHTRDHRRLRRMSSSLTAAPRCLPRSTLSLTRSRTLPTSTAARRCLRHRRRWRTYATIPPHTLLRDPYTLLIVLRSAWPPPSRSSPSLTPF